MKRVFKVEGKYLAPPIKVMFKLRMLQKLKDKYITEPYEDKWICWYYFPDDDKEYTYVNIVNMEIEHDDYEDDDWETEYMAFYSSDWLMAKNSYNTMNMFRLPLKYIKSVRIVQKFPRESREEYRDTLPDSIHWRDGSVYEEYDADDIYQQYYY